MKEREKNEDIMGSGTWVSRRIMRSVEILGSTPVEQCLAIALVSSDCTAKGGSIPAGLEIKSQNKTKKHSKERN